ncbi:hypothetical protein DIPPA_51235 [Diplonema papillatum]|nr:hypothetical protein DIPPA_51235 [Diplonema papillatum]
MAPTLPVTLENVTTEEVQHATRALAMKVAEGEHVVIRDGVFKGYTGTVMKGVVRPDSTGNPPASICYIVSLQPFNGTAFEVVFTEEDFVTPLEATQYRLVGNFSASVEQQTGLKGFVFDIDGTEYYSTHNSVDLCADRHNAVGVTCAIPFSDIQQASEHISILQSLLTRTFDKPPLLGVTGETVEEIVMYKAADWPFAEDKLVAGRIIQGSKILLGMVDARPNIESTTDSFVQAADLLSMLAETQNAGLLLSSLAIKGAVYLTSNIVLDTMWSKQHLQAASVLLVWVRFCCTHCTELTSVQSDVPEEVKCWAEDSDRSTSPKPSPTSPPPLSNSDALTSKIYCQEKEEDAESISPFDLLPEPAAHQSAPSSQLPVCANAVSCTAALPDSGTPLNLSNLTCEDLSFLQGSWSTLKNDTIVTVKGNTARFKVAGDQFGSEWCITWSEDTVVLLGCKLRLKRSTKEALQWDDGDIWMKISTIPSGPIEHPFSCSSPLVPRPPPRASAVPRPASAPPIRTWNFEYKSPVEQQQITHLSDDHIRNTWNRLDTNKNGYIPRADFDSFFDSIDHIGIKCQKYVDRILSQDGIGLSPGIINYNEFAIISLRLASR